MMLRREWREQVSLSSITLALVYGSGYARLNSDIGCATSTSSSAEPAYALRITIALDALWEDVTVTLVNRMITDALSNQVGADRKALQVVFLQNIFSASVIAVALQGLVDLEMIAPTGQFQAILAKTGCFFCQHWQGKVSPLPCKKCDRPCHRKAPFVSDQGNSILLTQST
ncbi:MAG: hypothetical protein K8J31_01060 [Anaerolineae bacterium]|nr:hypothetical protein [Anaerolineae bacterium]